MLVGSHGQEFISEDSYESEKKVKESEAGRFGIQKLIMYPEPWQCGGEKRAVMGSFLSVGEHRNGIM